MYYKINGITYGSVGISYIVTTLVTLINNNHVVIFDNSNSSNSPTSNSQMCIK